MLVLPAYRILVRPSQRIGTWLSRRNRPSAASASARFRAASLASWRWPLVATPLGFNCATRVDLDLGVGPQQRGRDLVGVDADGHVQAVVDDVLGRIESYVEHVFAARPAGPDAVGRVG